MRKSMADPRKQLLPNYSQHLNAMLNELRKCSIDRLSLGLEASHFPRFVQ